MSLMESKKFIHAKPMLLLLKNHLNYGHLDKIDIKKSIELIYKVKVNSVNIIRVKGKTKVFKGKVGKRSDFKKAIVSLVKGQSIDLSLGV